MTDERLLALSEQYGTPAFVFDAIEAKNRARQIKELLNGNPGGGGIRLCYSIKANPFLIPALMDEVDFFEVCSPGELSISEKYKVPGEKIIYSGVHKEREDIAEAVRYGASVLTAESARQAELIRQEAEDRGQKIRVLLRLSSQSQFGMSKEDMERILSENREEDLLEIEGIHYFAGTQRLKLKHQREELAMLKETVSFLREKFGLNLSWLEYGPGLGHPYFEGDDFSDTLSPLKELSPDLAEAAGWSSLTVEMGRFLASGCGYYLTRVSDVKHSFGKNWCILDGGINHVNYLGQIMGMKVPVIRRLSMRMKGKEESWCLCGSLCTTNDVLVRDYWTGTLSVGDVLAFCNIGAYSVTEGLGLFLSRDLPSVILEVEGKAALVRKAGHTWEINS